MTIEENIKQNLIKKRQILVDKNVMELDELNALMNRLSRRQIILFSLSEAKRLILFLEDEKLIHAHETVIMWACGKLKMSEAKKEIIAIHQMAKETNDHVKKAYYHAIAQGLSVVHTRTHQLGLMIYELTAIVIYLDKEYQLEVKTRLNWYYKQVNNYMNYDTDHLQWASFIKR